MANKFEDGAYGGECVTYAGMTYFGKRFNVNVAAEVYNASTVRKLSGPKSQCIACWSGGPTGAGHVGVVETWYPDTETMDYSDSNFVMGEYKIKNRPNIPRTELEDICGSDFTFQGYVEFK